MEAEFDHSHLRRRFRILDALVHELIRLIDEVDGDCDFEPDLGGKGNMQDLEYDLADACSDLELDNADIEIDAGDYDFPGHIWGGIGA